MRAARAPWARGFIVAMIPLSALGGARPPGGPSIGGMIPLGSLGGGAPTSSSSTGPAPSMMPPSMPPPPDTPVGGLPPSILGAATFAPSNDVPDIDTLAEVGKAAKDYLDVLMPIAIPHEGEDSRPVPKQIVCLEDGTDLFKMFDVDMQRFDPKAVRKTYHKMAIFVHPEKLGREPSAADKARFTKLKQAFTVVMDDQLRGVYRQHCFGIAGSGGTAALGHEAALAKSLELGRELRKMGEERAIVLHKAAETGWTVQQKDADGRTMRGDGRKLAHKFNLFADISSEEDDDAVLEKERRSMSIEQILERSSSFADKFLERVKPLLTDPKVSAPAAGGAFTMLEEPHLLALLQESSKTVQKHLRKVRTAVKQMNWAMTTLLQNPETPWRGLEVKSSLVEHGIIKLLEIIKSGMAFGKFSEVHEVDFAKLVDNMHRLYMDLFERRGQELLRAAIQVELKVVYLLPESGGRLPDGTKAILQDLASRPDLNGKTGAIKAWDYSLQRYTVELDKEEKKDSGPAAPANPDMFGLEDMDDEVEEEENKHAIELVIPKKLMVLPKNVLVDLEPAKKRLEDLVKQWNAWRRRPRSVSASQDAEAVAAALGPPLEAMAGYLQDAASAVGTGCATGRDGAELIATECREALQGARSLAAKLLGEEVDEPPPAPPLNEPPPALVPVKGGGDDEVSRALREAAEVAAAALSFKDKTKKRSRSKGKKKDRSKSRKRRRKKSSSSDSSDKEKKKKKS